jgi:hypothetical protein
MRTCKKRSDRSNTRLEHCRQSSAETWKVDKEGGEVFQISFHILAMYCKRVRNG